MDPREPQRTREDLRRSEWIREDLKGPERSSKGPREAERIPQDLRAAKTTLEEPRGALAGEKPAGRGDSPDSHHLLVSLTCGSGSGTARWWASEVGRGVCE